MTCAASTLSRPQALTTAGFAAPVASAPWRANVAERLLGGRQSQQQLQVPARRARRRRYLVEWEGALAIGCAGSRQPLAQTLGALLVEGEDRAVVAAR
jgi:hypothetical protein